ncbi:MAG: 30S ribosomal protein S8 [Planctomycetes bacterium GWF2_41_51]|nr:MAG: 30S ribosomal protein S8 [Planctomycetes bacterium GWF2_41_51]HBG27758.1 30S ribosomal protein S8 [Phycisphaerales bacterium]
MHSDPIADMLTRIRNAGKARLNYVNIKKSKICMGVAKVLQNEGYVTGFETVDDGTGQGLIRIELKYTLDGMPAITEIKRVSKTGRRLYCSVDKLPYVMNGMGIAIVTTNKGVMTDGQCRKDKVSGEILCTVC